MRNNKTCLIIYITKTASANFAFSQPLGIWGFPGEPGIAKDIKVGDFVLFGAGFSGGSPRKPWEVWKEHTIDTVTVGVLTSELYTDSIPFWPDEKVGRGAYPYRFKFKTLLKKKGPIELDRTGPLGKASEILRRSASSSAQTHLLPASDIPLFGELRRERNPVEERQTAPSASPATGKTSVVTSVKISQDYNLPTDWDWQKQMDALIRSIEMTGFVFEPWQIATYVTALRTKPFVILAGISGTGKSQLPQLVARACGYDAEVIPVRPDWTDSSDLLGYTDLTGVFRPGRLLELAETSGRDNRKSTTVILDEMNLARVEHYFAEVLSRIEDRRLINGTWHSKPLRITDGRDEKARDRWGRVVLPPNLAIVGTVNMDETTHGFSRKVLDRAFTLEMSDVNLQRWGMPEAQAQNPDLNWPSAALVPSIASLASENEKLMASRRFVNDIIEQLERLNRELTAAQLQIGYRSRDEIVLFAFNAKDVSEGFVTEAGDPVDPLDLAVCMKILPRITGGSGATRRVLLGVLAWAIGSNQISDADADLITKEWRSEGRPSSLGAHKYPRCSARLCLMWERLRDQGFTSYWL